MAVLQAVCEYSVAESHAACWYSVAESHAVCEYSVAVLQAVCEYSVSVLQAVCEYSVAVLQAVCEYSVAVLAISQTLLRSVQPAVSHFASSLYRHAFLTFDSYGQQVSSTFPLTNALRCDRNLKLLMLGPAFQ